MELHPKNKFLMSKKMLLFEHSKLDRSGNCVVECQILSPENHFVGISTSSLLYAAWALVIGNIANSNQVTFEVAPYPKTASSTINGTPTLSLNNGPTLDIEAGSSRCCVL